MILTIDGPAGTGKSSVALEVARRLGFDFLDTGAMYRAVGLAILRRGTDPSDHRELAFAARHCRIEFDISSMPPGLLLNDEPVSHLLRSADVTAAASRVAVVEAVRKQLVEQQRHIGLNHPKLVTEGRDQGSVVFPNADLKFYLDATPAERARRRVAQLRARGEIVELAKVQEQIESRDRRDSTREVGPLVIPAGATVIDTTRLSQAEVIEQIVSQSSDNLRAKGGAA
jgi:cytidylate kinase